MDEHMKRFLFFAVTKGKNPCVYCSWEDAKRKLCRIPFPSSTNPIATTKPCCIQFQNVKHSGRECSEG
ncbi:hypothetical protein S83_015420 [Arachis hypogaea]